MIMVKKYTGVKNDPPALARNVVKNKHSNIIIVEIEGVNFDPILEF